MYCCQLCTAVSLFRPLLFLSLCEPIYASVFISFCKQALINISKSILAPKTSLSLSLIIFTNPSLCHGYYEVGAVVGDEEGDGEAVVDDESFGQLEEGNQVA